MRAEYRFSATELLLAHRALSRIIRKPRPTIAPAVRGPLITELTIVGRSAIQRAYGAAVELVRARDRLGYDHRRYQGSSGSNASARRRYDLAVSAECHASLAALGVEVEG